MNQCPRCLKQFRTVFGDAEMQEIVHTCTPTKEWREMEEATEKSSKEIARLNALVAMQAEALKHAQKQPHPFGHLELFEKALSASSETVEAFMAEHAAKVLEDFAYKVKDANAGELSRYVELTDWLSMIFNEAAELRAANKKEGE